MNSTMLQQSDLKNQGQWENDDPFDLQWTCKSQGVTSLNTERALELYAQELVEQYAKFDGECYNIAFDKLSDTDQNKLLVLYFDWNGRETSDCVHGDDFSIDNDYTSALMTMLKENTKESRDRFSGIVRKNMIIFYAKGLQKTLDAACNDFLENINNEQGYYAVRSQEDGEIEWRKF